MVLLQEGDEKRVALADRCSTDDDEMTIILQGILLSVQLIDLLFFKPEGEDYLKAVDLIEVECVLVEGSRDAATLIGTLQAIGRPLAAVTCVLDEHKRTQFSLRKAYLLSKRASIEGLHSAHRLAD